MKKILSFTIIAIIALIALTTNVQAADTLQSKLDSAVLHDTVTLDADYTEDIVIKSGKNVTIDLNGKKLTGVNSDTITVEKGAVLTIVDSSDGKGEIINGNSDAAIFNRGTTTIEAGIIRKTDKNYYNIVNHGSMTINGGTVINETEYVEGQAYSSLIENGYYSYSSTDPRKGYVSGINDSNPSLEINGGVFNGGLNTVKNDDGGILVVKGGTFKNTIQVTIFNSNIADIIGGTFEVPLGDKTTVFNAKYDDSANSQNVGKLTVSGGTFNAEYFIETNDYDLGGNVSILGGTFNTTKAIVNPNKEDGTPRPEVQPVITGGTFSVDISEYLPEGAIIANDGTGNYIVRLKLDTPTNLKWDGTKATWDAVPNAEEYMVILTNGEWCTDPIYTEDTSVDFSKYLTDENGKYVFEVYAYGNWDYYVPTDFATSEAYVFPVEEDKDEEKPSIGEGPTEQEPEEEKDKTPETGSVDVVLFASAIVAVISVAGIVLVKKYTR